MRLIIHTDGGARGNPGPAAVGVVIKETNGKEITSFGKRIGDTTNNVAEYTGVIEALKYLKTKYITQNIKYEIYFYLDSTLVVNQLNGQFKVKESHLRELLLTVRMLEGEVGGVITYTAIPREKNGSADYFVNKALDEPTL